MKTLLIAILIWLVTILLFIAGIKAFVCIVYLIGG